MNKVMELLEELEELVKNLKPGTVAGGRDMPSVKTATPKPPKMPSGAPKTPTQPKIPGVRPPSQVNPVKSAEQTQNKDIKDIRMKEAQSALKAKPVLKSEDGEEISFSKSGQWSLTKAVLRRKPGELHGKTPDERHQGELEEKLKNPEFKSKALEHQMQERVKGFKAEAEEAERNATYDAATKDMKGADDRLPVASKKRNANRMYEIASRRAAPENKVINRIDRQKKSS